MGQSPSAIRGNIIPPCFGARATVTLYWHFASLGQRRYAAYRLRPLAQQRSCISRTPLSRVVHITVLPADSKRLESWAEPSDLRGKDDLAPARFIIPHCWLEVFSAANINSSLRSPALSRFACCTFRSRTLTRRKAYHSPSGECNFKGNAGMLTPEERIPRCLGSRS